MAPNEKFQSFLSAAPQFNLCAAWPERLLSPKVFLAELWCKESRVASSSRAGQSLSAMPWSEDFSIIWGQPHLAVIQPETCGIKWLRAVAFVDNWQLLRKA